MTYFTYEVVGTALSVTGLVLSYSMLVGAAHIFFDWLSDRGKFTVWDLGTCHEKWVFSACFPLVLVCFALLVALATVRLVVWLAWAVASWPARAIYDESASVPLARTIKR